MAQLDSDGNPIFREIERVCRADGCTNRFMVQFTSRGGRTRLYCSDSCKKQASRKGGAGSALSKKGRLQGEYEVMMREVHRLRVEMSNLMMKAERHTLCLDIVSRELEAERAEWAAKLDAETERLRNAYTG